MNIRIVCKINRDCQAEIAYRNPVSWQWPITFYAHIGQHSEGSYEYYRTLRPARTPHEHELCAQLIAEYRGIPPCDEQFSAARRLHHV